MSPQRTIRTLRLSTLVALLLCAAMLWVINEQDHTINGQRVIIRTLFEDSQELNELKLREQQREKIRKDLQKPVPKDAARGCLPGQVCG